VPTSVATTIINTFKPNVGILEVSPQRAIDQKRRFQEYATARRAHYLAIMRSAVRTHQGVELFCPILDDASTIRFTISGELEILSARPTFSLAPNRRALLTRTPSDSSRR
jgi:hypothetical protein